MYCCLLFRQNFQFPFWHRARFTTNWHLCNNGNGTSIYYDANLRLMKQICVMNTKFCENAFICTSFRCLFHFIYFSLNRWHAVKFIRLFSRSAFFLLWSNNIFLYHHHWGCEWETERETNEERKRGNCGMKNKSDCVCSRSQPIFVQIFTTTTTTTLSTLEFRVHSKTA